MTDHRGLDEAATATLEELFSANWRTVLGLVRRRVTTTALAEDISMTVFLAAAQRLASEPAAHISPAWLATVARRRVVDHYRTSARVENRLVLMAASVGAGPEDPAESGTRRCDVAHAVRSLPQRSRDAVVLRYWADLEVSRVATALGTTPKAAETLLVRSRTALADDRALT